jgi:hypothetical protein
LSEYQDSGSVAESSIDELPVAANFFVLESEQFKDVVNLPTTGDYEDL